MSRCHSRSCRSQETLLFEAMVALAAFLVAPVGGDAVLGEAVHLVRADLHLQRPRAQAENRRVQRAVDTLLRVGDVVVELAGNRLPEVVDDAERAVAVGLRLDEDAQRQEVVDLVEGLALGRVLLHLLVDAVEMLGAALHLGVDAVLLQLLAQDALHLGDVLLARGPARRQQVGDLPVALRIQVAEREVFQLAADLPDAEAAGQRAHRSPSSPARRAAASPATGRRACACCAGGPPA